MKREIRYCRYDSDVVEKLRNRGIDVHTSDDLLSSGYRVYWLYWPAFNWARWTKDYIGSIHHVSSGFLEDNGGEPLEPDEFVDFVIKNQ